jgi:RHS repeat-associated protein
VRRRHHRRPSFFTLFEPLEARQVMAITAGFSAGQLSIIGGGASDVVLVSTVNVGGAQQVTVNGQSIGAGVNAADVTSITADLGDGADRMDLSSLSLAVFSGLTEGSVTINGGLGNDRIEGTPLGDILTGGGGDDKIRGHGGDDQINGGSGADFLFGGDGDDLIIGGAGDDLIFGGAGSDALRGAAGADLLYGEAGDDDIRGGTGNDFLYGGTGNDRLIGGDGSDYQAGESGDDTYLYPSDTHTGTDRIDEHPDDGYDSVDARSLTLTSVPSLDSTEVQPLGSSQSIQFVTARTVEELLRRTTPSTGGGGVYTVPGQPGETTYVTFRYGGGSAEYYSGSIWVYDANDVDSEGFPIDPMSLDTLSFAEGSNGHYNFFQRPYAAGTELAFFIESGAARFYSVPALNDDGEHARETLTGWGETLFSWKAEPNESGLPEDEEFDDILFGVGTLTTYPGYTEQFPEYPPHLPAHIEIYPNGETGPYAVVTEGDSTSVSFTFWNIDLYSGPYDTSGDPTYNPPGWNAEWGTTGGLWPEPAPFDLVIPFWQPFEGAVAGDDFLGLAPGGGVHVIVIPAGESSATLTLTLIDDEVSESEEWLSLHVMAIGLMGTHVPADVLILDDDGGTVTVDLDLDSDNSGQIDRTSAEEAKEDLEGEPGKYVSVQGDRVPMTLDLSGGVVGTLSITSGADKVRVWTSSGDLILSESQQSVSTDQLYEGTVWVEAIRPSASLGDIVFTLTADDAAPDVVRMTAIDVVNVAATNAYATENGPGGVGRQGDFGAFTFSRPENNSSRERTLEFIVSGSAAYGLASDYTFEGHASFDPVTRKGTIRIPAGRSAATVKVIPVDDVTSEWDETITVKLLSLDGEPIPNDVPNTVTILDDDGLGSMLSRNVDAVSTGLVADSISNGTVAIGLEKGDVQVVMPMAPAGASPGYRSDDQLRPVASIEITLPEAATEFQAKLTIASGVLGDGQPMTFTAASGSVDSGDTIRFVVLGDDGVAEYLRTGHYDYDIEITVDPGESQKTRTVRGETEIVNLVNADFGEAYFGKRWWVDGLDRLIPGDGTTARYVDQGLAARQGMALVRGDNTSAWYAVNEFPAGHTTVVTRGHEDYVELGDWSTGTVATTENSAESYRYAGSLSDVALVDAALRPAAAGLAPKAIWDFEELEAGRQYQLFVTYTPGWDRTDAATYTVSGGTRVGSRIAGEHDNVTIVNQQYTPGETFAHGAVWRSIGYYTADAGGFLRVTLTNGSDTGTLVADAVMLVDDWSFQTPDGSFGTLNVGEYDPSSGLYSGGLEPVSEAFTLRDKTGTTRVFDGTGRLVKTVDRNANQTQLAYLTDNKLSTITVQGGLTWTYRYVDGVLDRIIDFAGRVFDYTVTGGLLTSIKLPGPGFGQGVVTTSFTYSGPREQLDTVTDGEEHITRLDYDQTSQVVKKVTNADGHDWELKPYLFDGLGVGTGKFFAKSSGKIGEFFDESEARATYTDARDHVWTYQLDRFGLMTAKSAPGTASTGNTQNVWKQERNAYGLVTRFTEPAGAGGFGGTLGELVTEYFYDNQTSHTQPVSRGNLTKVIYPQAMLGGSINIQESWTYSSTFSVPTSFTNGRGNTTTYVLDGRGNTTGILEPLDITTNLEYTEFPTDIHGLAGGLVREVRDPRGYLTTTEYFTREDGLTLSGLVKRVTRGTPDLDAPPEGPINWDDETSQRFEYDERRNRTAAIQEMGDGPERVTAFVFDTLDRLVTLKEPEVDYVTAGGAPARGAPTTQYRYDRMGRLARTTNPLGRATTYEYDPMGRREKTILPPAQHYVNGSLLQSQAVFVNRYDASGNLEASEDALGNVTVYVYDARNLLETKTLPAISDPGASVYSYTYDTAGNLATMTSPGAGDRTTKYAYDKLHRLTSETLPVPDAAFGSTHEAPRTGYTYDDNGNTASMEDAMGRLTTYAYDAVDRLEVVEVPAVESEGERTQTVYVYDSAGNLEKVKDAVGSGFDVVSMYDGLNRKIRDTFEAVGHFDAANPETPSVLETFVAYAYNDASELVEETDQLGRKTTREYDAAGRLFKLVQPQVTVGETQQSPTTLMEFDLAGNVRFVYDPNQSALKTPTNRTEYQYDPLDRRILVRGPASDATAGTSRPVTRTAYDKNGNVRRVIDPRGNATITDYNRQNLVSMVRLPDPGIVTPDTTADHTSVVTTFAYDPAGNRIEEVVASTNMNYKTEFAFDNLNRRYEVTDRSGVKTKTTYYADGRVDKQIQAPDTSDERLTKYFYDGLGRTEIVRVQRAPGLHDNTTTKYDAVGNLVELIDPAGNSTTYEYDALYRKTSETTLTDQGPVSRGYAYDEAGNLRLVTDRNGRKTQYDYDSLNRRTKESWLGATGQEYVASFGYDLVGNLVSVSDKFGTTSHSEVSLDLDPLYRVRQIATKLPGVAPADAPGRFDSTVGHQYDLVGNRTSSVVSVNGIQELRTTFRFDDLNRTKVIHQTGRSVTPKFVSYEYHPDGRVKELKREGGLIVGATSAAKLVGTSLWTYDVDTGLITSLVHKDTAGKAEVEYGFEYDTLNRLEHYSESRSQAVGAGNTPAPSVDQYYTYDQTNQVKTAGAETFEPGANGNRNGNGYVTGKDNRLSEDLDYQYTYDAEGNRTTRTAKAEDDAGVQQIVGTPKLEGGGDWTNVADGYGGGQAVGRPIQIASNPPAALPVTATWSASSLPAGSYDVYATWVAVSDGIQGVPFSITTTTVGGGTAVPATTTSAGMDFSAAPTADLTSGGAGWVKIGSVVSTGTNSFMIVLTTEDALNGVDAYSGSIAADAILFKPTRLDVARTSYEWDHQNRLTKVTNESATFAADGTPTYSPYDRTTYAYDVLGRRVELDYEVVAGNPVTVASFQRVSFYDGSQVVWSEQAESWESANRVTQALLWGAGKDDLLAIQERSWSGTTGISKDATWTLGDTQGSIKDYLGLATNGTSSDLIATRQFSAFGTPVIAQVWTTAPIGSFTDYGAQSGFFYAGQEYDATTGLYHNNGRYNDPRTTQFISQDANGPTGADTNPYRRDRNDPVNRSLRDRTWLEWGASMADAYGESSLFGLGGLSSPGTLMIEAAWYGLKSAFADTATVYKNTEGMHWFNRSLTVGGFFLADMTLLRNFSDFFYTHDAADGHVQSWQEQYFDGAIGVTGIGGMLLGGMEAAKAIRAAGGVRGAIGSVVSRPMAVVDDVAGFTAGRSPREWVFVGTPEQRLAYQKWLDKSYDEFVSAGGEITSTTGDLVRRGEPLRGLFEPFGPTGRGLPTITLSRGQRIGTEIEELYHFQQFMWYKRVRQLPDHMFARPDIKAAFELEAEMFLDMMGFAKL